MVKVRDYKHQDLEAIIKLMKLLSNILDIEFDEMNWKQTARIRIFNPEFRTLIAEQKGNIVGMCFADINRDETSRFHGIIRNVIVDPAFRKMGIASQLIAAAIDIFIKLEVDTIRVQVNEQIKDTIQLFQKIGFAVESIILEKDVLKIREYKDNPKDYLATKNLMQIYSKAINKPFNEMEWKQTLKIRIRNPQFRILISESEGKITGMAFIRIASDETGLTVGYIENIIVNPKYRDQGFGKDLLIRAIENLNVLNVDKIRIMLNLQIRNYLQYFEDVGFKKNAYLMEYKLPEKINNL